MKLKNPFKDLTRFELCLWLISSVVVVISFVFSPDKNVLTLVASLFGVTALIFIAKGYVIGQVLIIIFALLYGAVSFAQEYYGEVITYVCMSAPMAVMSLISWATHRYKDTKEVTVNKLSKWQVVVMLALTAAVTVGFYFILDLLGTANLIVSTLSVATSFAAVYLTFLRSPYYAIGYSLNDLVLITLWVMASIENPAYIPMILCFIMFLINDLYGFISWYKRGKKQNNI